MPLFEFDDTPGRTSNFTTFSMTFVDDGVTFTVSTTGNFSSADYEPTTGSGVLNLGDFNAGGTWTLDISTGMSQTNFATAGLTLNIASIGGSWSAVFIGTAGNVTVPITANAISPGSNGGNTHFTEIRFVSSTVLASLSIESLNATLMCYCAGTQIATPEGAVAVEDLRAGDMVLTADGRATEVTWLGLQPVETRLTHPAKVNPICISAGALAENVPSRDLFVSPDHAIEIDGVLYQASALVNGTSITMVEKMPRDGFTYYHVETAKHELLLAENCPAESFVEMGDLAEGFANIGERSERVVAEMDLPRVSDRRLVPAALRAKLAKRAEAMLDPAKAA